MNGGQNPDSTLEFELDIVFTRDGIREWNRIMFFSVDLYGEDRFRFEYANGSYDSVDGKIEKFIFREVLFSRLKIPHSNKVNEEL